MIYILLLSQREGRGSLTFRVQACNFPSCFGNYCGYAVGSDRLVIDHDMANYIISRLNLIISTLNNEIDFYIIKNLCRS